MPGCPTVIGVAPEPLASPVASAVITLPDGSGSVFAESRLALRLTQAQAAGRAGVPQGFWSAVERGLGATACLETLAACASAVDADLAAFIQAQPGSDLPRDIAHLRGQAAIVRFVEPGGWRARVEEAIDPSARRSRSIDVLLDRPVRNEIAVVELVDLLTAGGEAMRGLSDKVAAVRRLNQTCRVAAFWRCGRPHAIARPPRTSLAS
jgi:transcriptional regulator with XRE-family HTH domain